MIYSDIRARARASLQGRWALAIAAAIIAWLLGGLILGSSFIPEFSFRFRGEDMELKDILETLFTYDTRFGSAFLSLNLLALAQLIIGGAVQMGYAKVLLKQHDGKNWEIQDLFSEFHRFGQGFAQKFLRGLYCFLWGLLFIIPGIVKTYSYAMTPFLMADHPEFTASEAIDRSKQLMDGRKWELFLLHLTFIGWDLLAALTLNLGYLVLNPYKNAAEAAFYRQITEYPHITAE